MFTRIFTAAVILIGGIAHGGNVHANEGVEPVIEPVTADVFGAIAGEDLQPLDLAKLALEDARTDSKSRNGGWRFAIPTDGSWTPMTAGQWQHGADGRSMWRMRVSTSADTSHLNFGFSEFWLPSDASLNVYRPDGLQQVGPYTEADHAVTGQLWTPILAGSDAVIELQVATADILRVRLVLSRISQGYRGFGAVNRQAKAGSCNMDVACLGNSDSWNLPRGSVGAYTRNGSDICTGSLVNNTNNDRRMLFATATHCGNSPANIASVLVYWRYESANCRTPGSAASGMVIPRPSSTSTGIAVLAATNNPFGGGGAASTRSDWELLELSAPNEAGLDLYWAGWDRRTAGSGVEICLSPPLMPDPSSAEGLCASIHHPSVDEKRITFLDRNMQVGNIASASNVHWTTFWAGSTPSNSPPVLPNIPAPQPTTVVSGVTEPGSSGSPLYNAQKRLVGVLSGGASFCGASPGQLDDEYGALFHAYEGVGVGAGCSTTPPLGTTCMRPYLDPAGTNPAFIDGIGEGGVPSLVFYDGFEI